MDGRYPDNWEKRAENVRALFDSRCILCDRKGRDVHHMWYGLPARWVFLPLLGISTTGAIAGLLTSIPGLFLAGAITITATGTTILRYAARGRNVLGGYHLHLNQWTFPVLQLVVLCRECHTGGHPYSAHSLSPRLNYLIHRDKWQNRNSSFYAFRLFCIAIYRLAVRLIKA